LKSADSLFKARGVAAENADLLSFRPTLGRAGLKFGKTECFSRIADRMLYSV